MDSEKKRNKILLYYNAYSGSGIFRKRLDRIIERGQQAGYLVCPVRARRGIVIDRVLSEIDQSEFSRIIVAGGDGTVNLCVNAMVKNDIHLPLALLPSGTANDFAYYFDLPSDIDELLDIALGNRTTDVDVGTVNDKCFINVTAIGNLVDVSQRTAPNLKGALGSLAYYLTAISELPQVHPFNVTMTTPEQVYQEQIYFMVVMNGESAGGFRKLAPESAVNDGMLDVMALRKMPMLELGPLLLEVLGGRHPENKNVLYFQTDQLKLESDEDMETDVDGEHGQKLPLEFGVLKKRLQIFVSETGWNYDD